MAAEAADESDAASPRAPPTGDAHAKAGPGLFNMNAFRVPRLAKGLNLPPVTLPSLDTSGALAHSFRFWQPRADAQCGGPEVGGDERLIRANTVNEAETRVARDSGDGADEIRAATPPTRLPVCGNPAAAENREESEPPLPSPGGGGGAPGLHGQLMGIRSLLPELKVPQLSSFPQPWADSTPADACDCAAPTDDPTGAADSNSRALQKRASLLAEEGQPAWYAGVLGTKKKSDYAQTTRTWQGGHSRAPEPNVSVRSSDSVQLPRAPGDKDYDKLDAASWNLVEALSADASHWQPPDDVVDAAEVVLRRAHAEGQPPSSPKMPPVDDFFPPRNAPRRQGAMSGGLLSPSRSSELKPSGLGLTSTPRAHQPAPDELESAAHWYHWYQRGEGSGAVGPADEEFNSPLRVLNVNFTVPKRGGMLATSNSRDRVSADWFPPAPILARTLAHSPSPPDELQKAAPGTLQANTILHNTPALPKSQKVPFVERQRAAEDARMQDHLSDGGRPLSARAQQLPWYLQSAASRGGNNFSPGRPSVREIRDARLVSKWSPPQLSLQSPAGAGAEKDQSPKHWLCSPGTLHAPRGRDAEQQEDALKTMEDERVERELVAWREELERQRVAEIKKIGELKQTETGEDRDQIEQEQIEQEEAASARAKAIEEHDRRKREAEQALVKAKEEQKTKRDSDIASARARAQDELGQREAANEQMRLALAEKRKCEAAAEIGAGREETKKREEEAKRKKFLEDQARKEADQAKLAAFAERRRKAEEAAAAIEALEREKQEAEREEMERKRAAEIKMKKDMEEEEERRKTEEAKRKKELEEGERKKIAEAKRKKEIEEEEAKRKTEEAQRKKELEEEAERRKTEEAKRQKEIEEEEAKRKKEIEEESEKNFCLYKEIQAESERQRQSAEESMRKKEAAGAMVKNTAGVPKKEDAKLAAKKAAAMAARKMVVDSDDEDRIDGAGPGSKEAKEARVAAVKVLQAACRRYKAQRKRRMLVSLGTWSNLSDIRLKSAVGHGTALDDEDEVQPSPRKPLRITPRLGEDADSSKIMADLQDSRNFAGKFWQRRERERKEEEARRQQEEEQRLALRRDSAERGSEALKRLQQKLKEDEEEKLKEEERTKKKREDEEAAEAERKMKVQEQSDESERKIKEETAARAEEKRREEEEAQVKKKREEEEAARAEKTRREEEETAEAERKRKEEEEASIKKKLDVFKKKLQEQAAAEIERKRQEEAEKKQQDDLKIIQEQRRKEDEAHTQFGDDQMGLAIEMMRSNDITGARAATKKAADAYKQISEETEKLKEKKKKAEELLNEIDAVEQKNRLHLQAANAALSSTRKSLYSAAGASTAAAAMQAVDQAKKSLQSAEQEYAQAGTLHDRRQELDVLAIQVKAADKGAQKRQEHVMAGDTAVACAREKLVIGDVEGCRAARALAEVEYEQGHEDKKDILANLDDDIRNAAERKEMEERLERAKKKQAEQEEKKRREEAQKKVEAEERKREEERQKQEEECRRRREEEEKRREEEAERLKREEEERERKEAEAMRKAAAANIQCGDDHMAEARKKLETQDFDGARAARQAATDFYVKGGADRYDDLKKLDAEIDAAIKKKTDAEFFQKAKEKAFAQAAAAQKRWKEEEETCTRDAAIRVQAALRRSLIQKKRRIAGVLGHWSALSEGSGHAAAAVPRLSLGLPPPSPSPNRPLSAADEEARARRARERRLQYLGSAGGPSLLCDLQAALHMESPRPAPTSARSSSPMPHTTSAEVEADRARRAQERRNQYLNVHASPDALAQLQATLSASASGSPRYGSSPRVSNSNASPRSGHISPSYSSAAGARSGHMSPSYYPGSGSSPSPRVALPSPRSSGGSPSPRAPGSASPWGSPSQ